MVDDRIVIVGGGIGGVSSALALAQHGYRSVILEKAPELTEIGAGIQLGPNAFQAFDRLGVGPAARANAVFIDNLRLLDGVTGDDVAMVPLGEAFRARYGNPYAVIHRGELHKALVQSCKNSDLIELKTNVSIQNVEQDDTGVTAITEDGARFAGAALIGCDGLWSRVREQLIGDGAPRVSGHSTYRSVIPYDDMPEDLRINAATLWAGPKCHIVHYPLSDWKCFNLVVTYHNHAPEPVAGFPVEPEEVRSGFEAVSPKIKRVIDSSRNWKLWVLCDRDPIENWSDGRIVLLGDAAHPMMQYFAQGACMALEDAVCIADSIALCEGNFETAFAIYQKERVLRTARVQLQSRAIGDFIYHPGNIEAQLRNEVMRAKSADDWYRDLDWIYGHDLSLEGFKNRVEDFGGIAQSKVAEPSY